MVRRSQRHSKPQGSPEVWDNFHQDSAGRGTCLNIGSPFTGFMWNVSTSVNISDGNFKEFFFFFLEPGKEVEGYILQRDNERDSIPGDFSEEPFPNLSEVFSKFRIKAREFILFPVLL